jgi:hypothetical protein
VKNKKKAETEKQNAKKQKTGPGGDPASDIEPTRQHMASMLTGDGYKTITRRLPNACQQSHTTRYTINDNKISFQ